MLVLPEEVDVLEQLGAWGGAHPSIGAMILTSSRAKPDGRADVLSDYDVIVAVRDAAAFAANDAWAIGDTQELAGATCARAAGSKLVRERSTFEPRRTWLLQLRSMTNLCLVLVR